jgi:hypothetical protein
MKYLVKMPCERFKKTLEYWHHRLNTEGGVSMAREFGDARDFSFEACPWCGAEFEDSQVVKVQCDSTGPHTLFVQCEGCGVYYKTERGVPWRAEKVTGAKSLRQEIDDFLADRERLIIWKDR